MKCIIKRIKLLQNNIEQKHLSRSIIGLQKNMYSDYQTFLVSIIIYKFTNYL